MSVQKLLYLQIPRFPQEAEVLAELYESTLAKERLPIRWIDKSRGLFRYPDGRVGAVSVWCAGTIEGIAPA